LIKQSQFQQQHQLAWDHCDDLLNRLDSFKKTKRPDASELIHLPDLYSELCQQLAIAQSRCYSPGLIDYLHSLTMRTHDHLYRREFRLGNKILEFVSTDFPRTLRLHAGMFALSCLMFFGTMLVFGILCYVYPDLIYSVMDDEQISQMEYMYNPARGHIVGRSQQHEATSRVLMFGYYIRNNTGIGFQTFAGGMLAGIGTAFYLIYNGVVLGAVSGYLTQLGFGAPFWSFVAGHSAFELTAIAISGCAGLLLANAILLPGNQTRRDALRTQAHSAVILMSGAALLFLAAAAVEGFWSPIAEISKPIKYSIGWLLWLLLIVYLLFSGRKTHAN
jgi:uncharacterized membrane protein SpoIIM required for sporulation